MLPLIVWLVGCAAGIWAIVYFGFLQEAMALIVVCSVMLWIVGGAGWIGKRIQAGGARNKREVARDPLLKRLTPEEVERAAMQKSAEAHQPAPHS